MNGLMKSLSNLTYYGVNKFLPIRHLAAIAGSVRTTNSKRLSKPTLKGKFTAITLTDSALQRVRHLLAQQKDAVGLRIGVRARGCNGLSYTLDFCTNKEDAGKGCEVVEQDGIKIFIDRRAQLTLLGSEMDFQKNLLSSEFVFNNPNVTGTCGCGESFTV